MNKKAIIILAALLVLILGSAGVLIYQVLNKSKTDTPVVTNDETKSDTNTSPSATNKAIKLSDDQVVSPVLFYDNTAITFFNKEGRLMQATLSDSGNTLLLTNKKEIGLPPQVGIKKVLWPLAGSNFIVEKGSGASASLVYYDGKAGVYKNLPSQITSISWLPDGENVIYLWLDKGKTTLNIAKADNSDYQVLTDIWENDDKISVSPDGRNILFYRTNNNEAINSINVVSIDGKTFRSIVKDGYNFGVQWAPDAKHFVFGKRDTTGNYQLWVGDVDSGELKSLGVNTTPDKTVWLSDSSTLIAAVARSGTTGDDLHKIDIATGGGQIIDPGVTVSAQDLLINNANNRIFFRSQIDGSLYYLNL